MKPLVFYMHAALRPWVIIGAFRTSFFFKPLRMLKLGRYLGLWVSQFGMSFLKRCGCPKGSYCWRCFWNPANTIWDVANSGINSLWSVARFLPRTAVRNITWWNFLLILWFLCTKAHRWRKAIQLHTCGETTLQIVTPLISSKPFLSVSRCFSYPPR